MPCARGDLDGAIADYSRALELNPGYALCYAIDQRLVRRYLRNVLANQINDNGFRAAPQQDAAESRRGLQSFERPAQFTRNLSDSGHPLRYHIFERKEVEVMSLPMSQMKANERCATRKKEAVFALEESAQEILLQGAELVLRQANPPSASDQTKTPRRRVAGPVLAQGQTSVAILRRAK